MSGTLGVLTAAGPRFYPDDPLWIDDDKALDASAVVAIEDANSYDFAVNTFATPGERARSGPATSTRWTKCRTRAGSPIASAGADVAGGDAARAGSSRLDFARRLGGVGRQGHRRPTRIPDDDPEGQTYQIEFDPPSNPEMATGAEIIGTVFYHAFGYHTVEVYLTELDPNRITIAEKAARLGSARRERRRLTRKDIDDVLRRGARQPNGKYRVLASRFADGKPLGNFRYYGTRPDDPNDIVRTSTAASCAARACSARGSITTIRAASTAWTCSGRTEPSLRQALHVRLRIHHGERHRLRAAPSGRQRIHPGVEAGLADPGHTGDLHAALDAHRVSGSASLDRSPRSRSVRTRVWKPENPNPAFANMRADDAFWAARIVSRFDDAAIRAMVEKARYSETLATEYLTANLIKRRDKVSPTGSPGTNPLVDFALSEAGELTFANAAERAGDAGAAINYSVEWARFANARHRARCQR